MGKFGLGLTALALAGATAVTCATINDKDKQNNELKESNTQLEFTINNQKDELLSKELELERITNELNSAKSDITNLQNQLDSTIAEKTQLQKDVESRDKQMSELNTTIAAKEAEIAGIKKQLENKQVDLDTLQQNYNKLAEDAAAEKSDLQNQIMQKQSEIESLNTQLAAKQSEIETLTEQKSTLENEKATLSEKLDSIYSKVEGLYSDWNMTLPDGTELADTRDAQIEQKANAIAEYIDSQASQISELQTQVASLTEEVNTLQSTNEDLNNQITTLNNRISSLNNSVFSWLNRYNQQRDLYEKLLENQPQLGAPTVVNNAGVITVSDPNGIFGGEYSVMLNTDYGVVAATNAPEITKSEDGTYTFSISELGHLGTTSSIYVVAKGTGFKDSEKSNDVAITVDSVQFDSPILTYVDSSNYGKVTWEQITNNEEPCRKYTYSVFAIGDEDTLVTSGILTDVLEFDLSNLKTLDSGNYCIKLQCSAVTNFTASEYSNKVRVKVVKNSSVKLMGFDAPNVTRQSGNIISWEPVVTDGVECTNYKYFVTEVYSSTRPIQVTCHSGATTANSLDLSTLPLTSGYRWINIYCDQSAELTYGSNSNTIYFFKLSQWYNLTPSGRILKFKIGDDNKEYVTNPVNCFIYNRDTNELLKTAIVTGDEVVNVDMSDICPYNSSMNLSIKYTSDDLVDSPNYNFQFAPITEFSSPQLSVDGRILSIFDERNASIPGLYYEIQDIASSQILRTVYSTGLYDLSGIIPANESKQIRVRVGSTVTRWIMRSADVTFNAIEESQLNAPTISITDRTLTITAPTAAGESAVETEGMQFMIFDSATNKLLKTTTETTVDCSDICAADASITVYVIASLEGYADSVKSNTFSFDINKGGDTGIIDAEPFPQLD